MLLLEASGGLVAGPQFSRTFSQLDWALPDRNPPSPRQEVAEGVTSWGTVRALRSWGSHAIMQSVPLH